MVACEIKGCLENSQAIGVLAQEIQAFMIADMKIDQRFVAIDCELGTKIGRYNRLGELEFVELTASRRRIYEFTIIGTVKNFSIPPE